MDRQIDDLLDQMFLSHLFKTRAGRRRLGHGLSGVRAVQLLTESKNSQPEFRVELPEVEVSKGQVVAYIGSRLREDVPRSHSGPLRRPSRSFVETWPGAEMVWREDSRGRSIAQRTVVFGVRRNTLGFEL